MTDATLGERRAVIIEDDPEIADLVAVVLTQAGFHTHVATDGVVVRSGLSSTYGRFVEVKHKDGFRTFYAHLGRDAGLKSGTFVRRGTTVAYVGNSGRSTGSHLHFELRVNGSPVNPTSIKNMNTGDALAGRDLNRFNTMVSLIEGQFRKVNDGQVVAVNFQADAKQAAATKTKAD